MGARDGGDRRYPLLHAPDPRRPPGPLPDPASRSPMAPPPDAPRPEGCPAGPSRSAGAHERRSRSVRVALGITSVVLVAEAAGGWLTGSLALLADAGHMLSDVAALALSLWAIWFASRPSPAQRTYGNHRAEILAALANGVTLVVVALLVFHEAYERLADPLPVDSGPMLAIATIGLVANLGSAWLLHRGGATGRHDHDEDRDHDPSEGEDLNLRGAYLHVLGDALGSIGAIGAGVAVHVWGFHMADPIASVAIGILILVGSVRLVLRSVDVLLESAPANLDVADLRRSIEAVAGVTRIVDLHVWTITSGLPVLTLHASVPDGTERDALARAIRDRIRADFGIEHVTIELEGTGPSPG